MSHCVRELFLKNSIFGVFPNLTHVIKTGKKCNLTDGEGLKVPCRLKISGQKQYVNKLKTELVI